MTTYYSSKLEAEAQQGAMAIDKDAFARVRVSDPITLFDSQQQYNNSPLFWQDITTGSASITHLPNESALAFSVAGGESALRQTRAYFRYQPGKSQLVLLTGVMGAKAADITQRMGYYDDENGVFLEQDSTGARFVIRSKATGSVVDTKAEQANWNLVGIANLDLTKAQIVFFDMEWLGVGQVRCGFVIDGEFVVAHAFQHANVINRVYMTTANLPVRYELISGSTGTASDFKQICCSVISEGGFESERGIPFAADNGVPGLALSTATETPVISLRPKLTFNSITNRGQILLELANVLTDGNDIVWRVYYDAALTGASFTSAGDSSIAEYDVSATAFTGGLKVYSDYLASGGRSGTGNKGVPLLSKLPLVLDKAGTAQKSITITAQRRTAVSTNVQAAINWRELY